MIAFFSWYFILTFLGWLTFPLAYHLFPALVDRGYTLSRTFGLLLWGYAFWMFASLGISQNDIGGILFALAILVGLSVWSIVSHKSEIANWFKSNHRLILTTEVLFLIAFAFIAFVRASDSDLTSTEKPMELAFINAILRSPTFPPHDPWLSGYAISYYYFGYVLTAMLAKVTSLPGSVAHNLMTALIFGLGAIGAYGILYNLLAVNRKPQLQTGDSSASRVRTGVPLLAPLFLLLVSNFQGFLEILYRRGMYWKWLDVNELTEAPTQAVSNNLWGTLTQTWTSEKSAGIFYWFFSGMGKWFYAEFMPNRHYNWWWRASRVVQDYTLTGAWQEIIDEFPFFSFLLGDLHPHVLAIPFGLLAIAIALQIYLGASRADFKLFGAKLHLSPLDLALAALALGGLAFLNTWDILVGAALMVFAYILFRAREEGWGWARLEDAVIFGLPLAVLAVAFYLPFYLGFSSQAGGLLPNIVNPTRGAHLWIMFAPLFIPMFAYLYWSADKPRPNWRVSAILVVAFTLFLWGLSWLLAYLVRFAAPDIAMQYLESQGVETIRQLFTVASLRRLDFIGGLLTLLALLIPAVAYLIAKPESRPAEETPLPIVNAPSSSVFVFLLIALGGILILAPDFVYLRDGFGWRINTIFKFYYQAWTLWSLSAAYAICVLMDKLRSGWNGAFRATVVVIVILGLIYPVFSLPFKTNFFKPYFGFTLNDFNRIERDTPDEAAAIKWLSSAPEGIVAEAVGGSYHSEFARVATYSGLPTVLGWPGHEGQWRGGSEEIGSREQDIMTLYTTTNWKLANGIIQRYNIRYIFVGYMERSINSPKGETLHEEKFAAHLKVVFQMGGVTIYEAPSVLSP